MKIIVLGAGLVGGPMALDLSGSPEFDLTVADISQSALKNLVGRQKGRGQGAEGTGPGARNVEDGQRGAVHGTQGAGHGTQGTGYTMQGKEIQTVVADLSDPSHVTRLVSDYDMVINAVPGFMGFQTLKAIIGAGKNVIDIAFFIEDPFELDELARKNNVTAIMDMGVAPGMCNVLIGYADHLLDETENILYMVGGLPEVREWPYEYKAVFSPVDVIEEYTRPARYIENGKFIVKPALSDPELLNFPGIGTLEAFNTDGLRSLAHTVKCPNMKEKTLRYPGHIEKMRVLRETGFFSQEEIEVRGIRIKPMDLTAKLLFPKWKLEEGEVDITVMQVMVEGRKDGKAVRYTWDLFDKYDPATQIHSMARTTGYSATVALRMVAAGLYTRKGISVPEFIGRQPECVAYLLNGLKERGVIYRETVDFQG